MKSNHERGRSTTLNPIVIYHYKVSYPAFAQWFCAKALSNPRFVDQPFFHGYDEFVHEAGSTGDPPVIPRVTDKLLTNANR